MEVNKRNKSDSIKKIEKQSIPNDLKTFGFYQAFIRILGWKKLLLEQQWMFLRKWQKSKYIQRKTHYHSISVLFFLKTLMWLAQAMRFKICQISWRYNGFKDHKSINCQNFWEKKSPMLKLNFLLITSVHSYWVVRGLNGVEPIVLWSSQFLTNLKIWLLFRNVLKFNFLLYLAWSILKDFVS